MAKKLTKEAIYAICQASQNKHHFSDKKKEECILKLKKKYNHR